MQSEGLFSPQRTDCLQPEHWSTVDDQGTEHEVSVGIGGLVRMLQPDVVVETGTYMATTSVYIAEALAKNGHGKLFTIEINEERAKAAQDVLSEWGEVVEVVNGHACRVSVSNKIDLLFIDGGDRFGELKHFMPNLTQRGVILIHDSRRSHEQYLCRFLRDNGWSVAEMPTPRGLAICRHRA